MAREENPRRVQPLGKAAKRLLPHERQLLEIGQLVNCTHPGSSSIWLDAPSSQPDPDHTCVYRPMGDAETLYLVEHNQLPNTQPYQTIVESRDYAEKYLNGKKWVDTHPTTVVEFVAPKDLIQGLFAMYSKPEDGCLSTGLGDKGGGGLSEFNESMAAGRTTWRIVKIKRAIGAR
eukprot:TRINITY_DN2023_c0_g3_i1.p1 TRINITY_DN2023_c0_g3~~TRINITY_DN2023_c0_g3_i1.p1  ORF type:complete len:175 (-),score=4.85 TRINITY_DN2023_c0_g3_i1:106-630(-)